MFVLGPKIICNTNVANFGNILGAEGQGAGHVSLFLFCKIKVELRLWTKEPLPRFPRSDSKSDRLFGFGCGVLVLKQQLDSLDPGDL